MRESACVPPPHHESHRTEARSSVSPRRIAPMAKLSLIAAGLAVVMAGCARGQLPQDSLSPEGPQARQLDRLWDLVLPIALVVGVLVMGLLVFSVIKFRAKSDDDRPVQVHGNAKAEIAWTIAPALLLAFIGVFTVVTVFDINKKADGAEVLQVEVTGHQWWWEYHYPNQDITTANELVIPAGREVQVSLTSADVIHNFWPPKLSGKVYAIPGRVNYMHFTADKPGDYSGQCAEFCGLSHANMRLRVVAYAPDKFDEWVANQQQKAVAAPTTTTTAAPADDAVAAPTLPIAPGADPVADQAAGAELFIAKGCSGCHSINGLEGANGKVGPNLTHLQSRSRFAGDVFELNNRNLRRWLRNPPAMKPMNPDNGQGMPNLGLSEDEITQLIAYLETLK